ncbi:SDR family NAD(P)-dependent oxidoreductase [Ekhidna sp. To15]|uniref:SDR family NAD(P)-dependent oxidoreductase n=1 Tax=Ekhidna sp. To15 TaxID=3395267 RepID=UPI003F5217CE
METSNRVCVITGAAHGIGTATARLMSLHGMMNVVLSDQDKDGADSLMNQLNTIRPKSSIAFTSDVSNPKHMSQLMKAAFDRFGRLDVLVNNAGISQSKIAKTADSSLEDWDKVIAVNQSGVYYGMKYAIPYMIEQGHGIIINVSSLAGLIAAPNHIAYAASKAAVINMTKTVALEYGRQNIRVNAVCPGYTDTNHFDQLHETKPELKERLLRATPMKRYAKVDEIADSIYWLCSDQTTFITGQTLTIDGGISL